MEKLFMIRGAKILVEVCADVQPDENVLIVTDRRQSLIVDYLATAVLEKGAEVTIGIMTPRKGHGFEPPKTLTEAMLTADVIFAPTLEYSISHSSARVNACNKGARYINMAGYRDEMLIAGGLFADFVGLAPLVRRVGDLFGKATDAVVISGNGAKISFNIKDRRGNSPTGLARNPGEASFPPAVQANTTPLEGISSGKILIDGSIPIKGGGIVSRPVELTVEKGQIVRIEGGHDAKLLNEYLSSANDEGAFMISEIGIGLNPECRLSGVLLEDEGVLGSIHFGIGGNTSLGGCHDARLHLDVILIEGTLILDNNTVIDRGRIALEEWRDK